MKAILPALGVALLVAMAATMALPPRGHMARAVREYGFSDVHVTGFALFGCSEQDIYREHWTGRNRAGQPVAGVICGGVTKGWTVRLS